MSRERTLARTLIELADTLIDDFDVVEFASMLARRCVEVLDVDQAGLLLLAPGGGLHVLGSSSEEMRTLELFELQAREGPCFDCQRTGEPVRCPDLSDAGGRWPRFCSVTVEAGYRSVHALPMRLRGSVIGALSLFRGSPGLLDDDDVAMGQAFADVATISLLQHRAAVDAETLNQQLKTALHSRIVLEQAKGRIAERLGLGMEESFAKLRNHARRNHVRLADVAAEIVSGVRSPDDLDAGPARSSRRR